MEIVYPVNLEMYLEGHTNLNLEINLEMIIKETYKYTEQTSLYELRDTLERYHWVNLGKHIGGQYSMNVGRIMEAIIQSMGDILGDCDFADFRMNLEFVIEKDWGYTRRLWFWRWKIGYCWIWRW